MCRYARWSWPAVLVITGCGLTGGGGGGDGYAGGYPSAPRGDRIDDYHGVSVADPYRWLEDLGAPATREWIAAENELTERYLARLPAREKFATRLERLIDYERYGIPQHRAGRYVYAHNTGRQEQDTWWVTDAPVERGRLLLDPNRLSADGTVSIGAVSISPDGDMLAYSVSDGGTDWKTWRVLDIASGASTGDRLSGTKFTSVSWLPDSSGFFYSRYPETGDGYDGSRQVTVRLHRLGAPQAEDALVYAVTDHPTRNPYAHVTDDGEFLVITLFDGYETNGVYVQRLVAGRPTGDVIRLLDDWDARYEFIGNRGSEFFFHTTHEAPLGRIVAIRLSEPAPARWREVVAEREQAIESASMAGSALFVQYIVDAHSSVRRFALDGGPQGAIELPGRGTVEGFAGRAGDTETFFSYTDFTTPVTVYRYDIVRGMAEKLFEPDVGIDPQAYVSRQSFVTSADGTQIPVTVVRARRLAGDVPQPTVLYGYGGFGVSLLPRYSTARMAWLAAGGVYAVANLRGGGEYGEAWHLAGTRLNKQHVFDDFTAAAEWLISTGQTTPDRLAIWGGSNGGLLVAAVANQHPELFAAVVPAVGVLDMLRYQTASANARQWSSDYGLSENLEEFQALYAYSPLHNIKPGTCYPATLVMADANDDRVVPWHSYKYAAALQYAQGCDRPVLIRIETRTGHGAGAATSKIVSEYADQWAFVARAVGLDPR